MEFKVSDTVAEASEKAETKDGVVSSKVQICLLMMSLFCGTFVMALDSTIIGTAVPSITTQFGALDDIAWYGSAYLLTITAFQPLLGKLYRFFNIKLVFMTSIVVFEGKSFVSIHSQPLIRTDYLYVQWARSSALRLHHQQPLLLAGHLQEQVLLACSKGLSSSSPRLFDSRTVHCVSAL